MYNMIYSDEKWELVNKKNKQIMNDYLLEYKSRKMKESTLYQYKNDLRIVMIYILDNLDNAPITSLGRKDFRNFSMWCSELGMSNARVNRLMSCVRSLLTYVEEDDDYEDYNRNQAKSVKGLPKEPIRDIIFIDADIYQKLYNKFIKEKRYRDATLLALGIESTARKNELAQVLKASITEDGNYTNVVTGKRGKRFPLMYFHMTKKAAKLYMSERTDNAQELFVTLDGKPARADLLYDVVITWRKDLKELTGKDILINVHSLRHSGLQMYKDGTHPVCIERGIGPIPIEQLKTIAKHSDLQTTLSYLKDETENELAETFGIKLKDDFSQV